MLLLGCQLWDRWLHLLGLLHSDYGLNQLDQGVFVVWLRLGRRSHEILRMTGLYQIWAIRGPDRYGLLLVINVATWLFNRAISVYSDGGFLILIIILDAIFSRIQKPLEYTITTRRFNLLLLGLDAV
jgi:hypothetical protein